MNRFLIIGLLVIVIGILTGCGRTRKKQEPAPVDTNVPEALQKLNEQLESDSTNADLYEARAKYYIDNKQTNNALGDINKAIQLQPGKGSFLLTLSDIYLAMGNASKCNETLLTLVAREPDNTEVYLKLSELNLYLKDYEKSIAYADKALEVDPVTPRSYFIKGYIYKEKGDTAKAIRNFQLSIDQKQDFYEAYMQLALIMAAKKKKLAEDYYKNAIKIKPSSIETLYGLGLYYQENAMYNEAISTYNDLLRVDPKNKLAYFNLGYLHLVHLRVYDVAVKYFTDAINCDPGYYAAYYNRGYSFEMMGDVMNARKDFHTALGIKPNYPMAIEGLNRLDRGDKIMKNPQ